MIYTAHKLTKIAHAKKLRKEEQDKRKKQKDDAKKLREDARKKAAIDRRKRLEESGLPGKKELFVRFFVTHIQWFIRTSSKF